MFVSDSPDRANVLAVAESAANVAFNKRTYASRVQIAAVVAI